MRLPIPPSGQTFTCYRLQKELPIPPPAMRDAQSCNQKHFIFICFFEQAWRIRAEKNNRSGCFIYLLLNIFYQRLEEKLLQYLKGLFYQE